MTCRRSGRLEAGVGITLIVALVSFARAGSIDGLNDTDRRRLERGEVVVKTQALADYPWPEVSAYKKAGATPDEVMAIYVDFEGQATYLPRMTTSRILKQLNSHSWHVFYEYKTPLTERYTLQVTVGRAGDGYRASWDLIAARHTRRLSGEMRVEPFGAEALITYTNRVDPGLLGRLFGSPETAAERLEETVQALAARVERLRAVEPSTLRQLVNAWKAMLKGL